MRILFGVIHLAISCIVLGMSAADVAVLIAIGPSRD